MCVASLRVMPESEEKSTCPQPQGQGRGLKGPGVTHMRPESRRSIPGQDEAGGNSGGGPIGF